MIAALIPDQYTAGPHFEAFCLNYVRHTKGRWAGQRLILEDWQREFWWEALELDPATGRRVYQEIGLGLPRKNSKSTMASAGGLYFLLADGEAEPEVYIGAGAQHQANVVYGQIRSMVRASPALLNYIPTPGRYLMESHRNNGVLRSLSSDGALQHGLSPSANIIDEIHAHKNGDLYTALTTATGAREQPFTLWITTAGVAGEGILAELYDSMFAGTGELERRGDYLLIYRDRVNGVLIYWYGASRDADIESPEVWRAVNPASWLQDGRWMGAQFERLRARGALLEWRQYHLNQFTDTAVNWLPEGRWAACADPDLELDPHLPVGIGTDRSPDGTLGAIVVAQRQGEAVVVRSELFPAESATGMTSAEAMRQRLREHRLTYPAPMTMDDRRRRIPGPAFGFDRVAFRESAEMLDGDGLNMVDMPMAASTMAPPSTMTYELITTGRLKHNGDPVLAEHVANTTAMLTDRGMKVARPKVKSGSAARPNVACIALVRAVGLAMQEAPKPFIARSAPAAVGF